LPERTAVWDEAYQRFLLISEKETGIA
jgi:hypothetical protein